MAFVEPALSLKLTPLDLDTRLWLGFLSIATFFATIVQFKTDWKGKADAHKRSLQIYAEVKREAGYLLASRDLDKDSVRRVLARYDLAAAVGIPVPEGDFLPQKRRHKMKVALSRHLDSHPGASLWLTQLKFWWRDNVKSGADNER
ncbi:hypothetical protein [Nisaea sediminum]|uniref:hypothetical protein n=1 Tax=Nisaea sediminum TaxID=2775867 RepID=UPI0018674E6E|nr:hypothetical protein [Nisaea sediminum]